MKKVNYKLIVSDFDGTLVNSDGVTVCKENRDAMVKYISAGGKFVISSGRQMMGLLPIARSLGLSGLLCCSQGASIVDIESGETVLDGRISYESTLAACLEMEKLGLHIHAYSLFEYYSNMDDEGLKLYQDITGTKAKVISDRPLSEFIKETKLSSCKMLAMVDPSESDKVMKLLQDASIPGCTVTKSASYLVEVLSCDYSKGTAIEFLAKHYSIPVEKVIAVGDQLNDIPMIETAGLGAAVANAEKALKVASKYVCERTNNEGAIAEIIEKFGFEN